MDDCELLSQFENCTLPFTEWSHKAHVKVSFLYLSKYPFDEALTKMRAGIKAYIQANDVPNEGPLEGYNETTTHAFMHLVDATMKAYGTLYPTPNADLFCDTHPQLLSKHLLRLFYSPKRRGQPEAKTQFVEPDLTSLPEIPRFFVESPNRRTKKS